MLDGTIPTLICTSEKSYRKPAHAEVIILPEKNFATQVLHQLFERKIMSVIIEGGQHTLQTFINENQWDEARIFTSPARYSEGKKAPVVSGRVVYSEQIGNDNLTIIKNTHT